MCLFSLKTWLNDNIPDSAIQLNKLTCYRADIGQNTSGKSRGGGLCLYINKEWCCNNAAVISKHCSSLVEFMFVKCRPFYLPREFTAIVIAARLHSKSSQVKSPLFIIALLTIQIVTKQLHNSTVC